MKDSENYLSIPRARIVDASWEIADEILAKLLTMLLADKLQFNEREIYIAYIGGPATLFTI